MPWPKKYDHIDFTPPKGVAEEAELGLRWRREHGRGGTDVGVARGRDLSNRERISPSTIKRMVSYFARHEVDKKAEGSESRGFWDDSSNPSAGRIAWALWGGDAGRRWSEKVARQMESADKESAMSKGNIDVELGDEEITHAVLEFSKDGHVFENGDSIIEVAPEFAHAMHSFKRGLGDFVHKAMSAIEVVDAYDIASGSVEPMTLQKSANTLMEYDIEDEFPDVYQAVNDLFGDNGVGDDKYEYQKTIRYGMENFFKNSWVDLSYDLEKEHSEDSERFVLGVVLEPNDGSDGYDMDPDAEGDIYSAEEVRKAAHWYMEHGRLRGLLHGRDWGDIFEENSDKIVVLESYVTLCEIPEGVISPNSPLVKKGSWVMAVRINDSAIWEMVERGVLTGFSVGGNYEVEVDE